MTVKEYPRYTKIQHKIKVDTIYNIAVFIWFLPQKYLTSCSC